MKKLLILLLVFVLTLGFGGCGNGDENAEYPQKRFTKSESKKRHGDSTKGFCRKGVQILVIRH